MKLHHVSLGIALSLSLFGCMTQADATELSENQSAAVDDPSVDSQSSPLSRPVGGASVPSKFGATDTPPYTCPQWCFEQCWPPGTPIDQTVKKCFEDCKATICRGKI